MFHRIVLAMIRRIIHQLNRQLNRIYKLNHALDELRPMTRDLWSIVQVDLQRSDVRVAVFVMFPPKFQTINDKITRLPGLAIHNIELLLFHFQNAEWQ